MIVDRPFFASIERAFLWAYYDVAVSGQTVSQSSIAQFIGTDSREQTDAEPIRARSIDLDAKPRGELASGQAGSIKAMLERYMGRLEAAHLLVRFLRRELRTNGRRAVTAAVLEEIPHEGAERGLIVELVAYTYGRKLKLQGLEQKYNVGRRRRREIHRQVHDFINALAYRAETEAYERLQRMGVIL